VDDTLRRMRSALTLHIRGPQSDQYVRQGDAHERPVTLIHHPQSKPGRNVTTAKPSER